MTVQRAVAMLKYPTILLPAGFRWTARRRRRRRRHALLVDDRSRAHCRVRGGRLPHNAAMFQRLSPLAATPGREQRGALEAGQRRLATISLIGRECANWYANSIDPGALICEKNEIPPSRQVGPPIALVIFSPLTSPLHARADNPEWVIA